MDQRFARPLYNWAVDTNPRLFILPVFVAAGICQSGDPNRLQAMRVIAQYCLEKLNVKKVIASGHNCGCGGVAHIMFKGQKVYEALKCAAGDKKENTYMQNAISVSVNEIFDRQQRRIVQKVLVAQSGEKINFVTFR
ncbi:MAG: hypothetical protein BroJett025_10320 [Patescibacteria group bacterium]|nr:MAG: hypothetical protein BroJett025_10320 [Patescibacteria group bacterium]